MLSRLLAPWRQPAASGSVTGDNTHYIFKSSLAAGARQLQLTDTGLTVQTAQNAILAMGTASRPSGCLTGRLRCSHGGFARTSKTPMARTSRCSRQHGTRFRRWRVRTMNTVRSLWSCTAGCNRANSSVRLTAGINPVLYALGLVAMALIGFSIAGLFVRALVTAEFAGALFLVGFAAWFTWQIGGFMRRNQPRIYTFDALPKDVLP